jgi:hypothetical protein
VLRLLPPMGPEREHFPATERSHALAITGLMLCSALLLANIVRIIDVRSTNTESISAKVPDVRRIPVWRKGGRPPRRCVGFRQGGCWQCRCPLIVRWRRFAGLLKISAEHLGERFAQPLDAGATQNVHRHPRSLGHFDPLWLHTVKTFEN